MPPTPCYRFVHPHPLSSQCGHWHPSLRRDVFHSRRLWDSSSKTPPCLLFRLFQARGSRLQKRQSNLHALLVKPHLHESFTDALGHCTFPANLRDEIVDIAIPTPCCHSSAIRRNTPLSGNLPPQPCLALCSHLKHGNLVLSPRGGLKIRLRVYDVAGTSRQSPGDTYRFPLLCLDRRGHYPNV